MTKEEAIDILRGIAEIYPRYEITERKCNILIPSLMKMDYEGVLRNLSSFAIEHSFPPTIADIAFFPPEKNTHLEKVKKWEEGAAKVPLEVKEKFRVEILKLLKEKSE